MLSPMPDSLSGGYAPSEPARPKSANRQHASGERSMTDAGVLVISAARRPLDLTSLWRKVEVRESQVPLGLPLP